MPDQTPYILHLALSNHARFDRSSYLMEYSGVRFKLIQQRGWKLADHLLTIIPDISPQTKQYAFQVGQELINLLSWELRSPMQLSETGARSCHIGTRLSQARPSMYKFIEILFEGNYANNSPSIIPAVNNKHQRLALGLFREARSSNNIYHAFLFYWHVIDTGRESGTEVVNRILGTHKLIKIREEIARLSLCEQSIGKYLWENMRNAIAHIQRKEPELKHLDLSNLEDRNEMVIATHIVRRIAETYIEHDLGVGKHQLYLMRKGRNGFPTYVDPQYEKEPWKWKMAYLNKPSKL